VAAAEARPGASLDWPEQDDSALGKSLERSQQFLLLSALLTLLLAVAAVAVAMSHYCRSRYDLVAILKTLGAGRAQLRKLIVGQWLLLTLSVITGGARAGAGAPAAADAQTGAARRAPAGQRLAVAVGDRRDG
jgi:predicted lysophospholipase L1 biosynthesis ABC-type transport system permease subunit